MSRAKRPNRPWGRVRPRPRGDPGRSPDRAAAETPRSPRPVGGIIVAKSADRNQVGHTFPGIIRGRCPMMPITREEIEILLDSPDQTDYVVSAFADLTVKDGFRTSSTRNSATRRGPPPRRSGGRGPQGAGRQYRGDPRAVREEVDPSAKGVAVFVSAPAACGTSVPLDFPVENRLVIDEEPFVLPLLERWHGEPSYLVALVDSDHAHVFEAHHGVGRGVHEIERPDIDEDSSATSRGSPTRSGSPRPSTSASTAPRRTSSSRGSPRRWPSTGRRGIFDGLILLGRPTILGAMRQLLPKDLAGAMVEEPPHAMTARPDDVADEVARAVEAGTPGATRSHRRAPAALEGGPPRGQRPDRRPRRPPAGPGRPGRSSAVAAICPGRSAATAAIASAPRRDLPLLRRRLPDDQRRAGDPPDGPEASRPRPPLPPRPPTPTRSSRPAASRPSSAPRPTGPPTRRLPRPKPMGPDRFPLLVDFVGWVSPPAGRCNPRDHCLTASRVGCAALRAGR